MLLGSVRARFLKASMGNRYLRLAGEQRWLGFAAMFAVEIALGTAAAPYVLARTVPAESQGWNPSLWQICSIDRLTGTARVQHR
jgi:hypothetical protein